MTAVAFCGAVYFRERRWSWLPFGGLCLTDLYINWFYAIEYGYYMEVGAYVARFAAFAVALGIGVWVSRRKSWLWLLNGSLLGALLFYFITNTQSWWGDIYYAKNFTGWWQALTIGHPEYPPTIFFFRNTLFGDLMFTGLFCGLMEWWTKRIGEPSLMDEDGSEETVDEKELPESEVQK